MWCTTECWNCEDKTCDSYKSKQDLYWENKDLKKENDALKERVAYLERSNNRREDTIIGLRFDAAEEEEYKEHWDELKSWLEEYRTDVDDPYYYEDGLVDCIDDVLDKMKEIVGGNK